MTHTRLRHPTPPTLDVLPVSWMERAACAGTGLGLWFRPSLEDDQEREDVSARLAREARAKAICATCPVKEECLAWAYDVDDWSAILGGLDPDERRKLRRKQQRKVAAR